MKKKFLVSWKAHDFEYKEKGTDWYWITSIIFLSLSVVFYHFLNDLIFALLILVIFFIVLIASKKKPNIRKHSIDTTGFIINDEQTIISFKEIAGYFIDEINHKILINTKKKYQPLILVPFEKNQKMEKVDKILSKKIKKDKELKIPTLEIILLRLLGF